MGKYNGAVITTAGQNVIAQAISGTEMTWTVMRTSSTVIPASTNLETLTSLSGIEQTSKITDATIYGDNVLQVSARFSNTNISTAYYIQTVGIYGQLTGGSDTLIAVMTAVTPDEMPVYDPDSPSAFIFNTQITVQNADAVTMTVNDTGTATVADLNRKLDKTGDASDAKIGSSTASTASYPIPAVNDTFKVILGKIIKFFTDIKAAYTNVSISGKKITFTTAAGDTKEITTQDTTYGLASTSANGLLRQLTGNTSQWMRGDGTWQTAQNNATTTAEGYVLDARMGKTLNDAIVVRNSGYVDGTTNGVTVPNTGAWTNVMFVKPTGGAGVYLVNVHLNAQTQNDKFTGVRIYIESTDAKVGGVILNDARTYHDTRIITLTASDLAGRIFVQVSSITACTFEASWEKNIISIIRLY